MGHKLGILIAILLTPGQAGAAAAGDRLHVAPLEFALADGTRVAAEQGRFTVKEDRRDPASRDIAIQFVRFKSTNPRPGPPIVYLAGGPGGSGVETARGPRQPVFMALRAAGDVIALDQRGTGLSNAIPPCRADRTLDEREVIGDRSLTAYYRQTLAKCVAEWTAAGVAVNGYTTRENADDIEALRRLLGVPQVNLWGISYGSQLALEMIRRHPRSVDRVILASVDGTDQNIKLPLAVDATFQRIAASQPGLLPLMRSVHRQLDREPLALAFTEASGTTHQFRMDSFPMRMLAGILAKNPDGIPQLVGAYQAVAAGKGAALGPQVYQHFLKEPLRMSGMAELMDVASGLSPAKQRQVSAQIPSSLLGDAANFPVSRLIGMVPGLDLGAGYRQPIRSARPVLIFSGDLDPRTPLEEQAVAIADLTRRHQVIVRNGGHDLFEAHPAIAAMMVGFFEGRTPTARELVLPAPPAPGAKR